MGWTYLVNRELTGQCIPDWRHVSSGIKGQLPGYGGIRRNGCSLEEEARGWAT